MENKNNKLVKSKKQKKVAKISSIRALIFVIFKGDLLGYDSYVPSKDKIESCAYIGSGYDYQIYKGSSYYFGDDVAEEYMYITDVDTFIQIAKLGMSTQKQWRNYDSSGQYKDLGWNDTICYRLKNGRCIYREICIPYDIDEKLLSKIVDSDEYQNGYFIFFHDEDMREFDAANARSNLGANNASNLTTGTIPAARLIKKEAIDSSIPILPPLKPFLHFFRFLPHQRDNLGGTLGNT